MASTSPRVSAAVAVPALTIAAPTCTGPCAPAGWAAGYGNYRLTGTTTAPAGSIVDVAVVIDAVHTCVKTRGVQDESSLTRTSKLSGAFQSNPALRAEFYASIPGPSQLKVV